MSISKAKAEWTGNLKSGRGIMFPENAAEVPFSLSTRFEGAKGSNPEEMIGAPANFTHHSRHSLSQLGEGGARAEGVGG